MKTKRLFKFYFKAEDIGRALDNLILKYASSQSDWERGGEFCAERVADFVGEKAALEELWGYLDGVMGSLNDGDRAALEKYALARTKIKGDKERLEIKRAVMKFRRHARRLERFKEEIEIVDKYYCLL